MAANDAHHSLAQNQIKVDVKDDGSNCVNVDVRRPIGERGSR